ncbi:MAG: FAD-dependent oxidoreductase, partial [bacterium]
MQTDTPVVKDIVLIGGGHAHVSVLRMFGMKPMPGVRLTLITRDIHTPYSGMLPGYIAGHYGYDDVHIDLGPLARFAGARLYHGEVDDIDVSNRTVQVPGRPPVHYDLLSVNTGSRPRTLDVPGALEYALPVKPIDRWLNDWEALQQRVLDSQGEFRIVVVGGGAGGVELALSTQHRLQNLLEAQGDQRSRIKYTLLTESAEIFSTHNAGVRRRFNRVLTDRDIEVSVNSRVTAVEQRGVHIGEGDFRPADAVLWVTSAGAPSWPA